MASFVEAYGVGAFYFVFTFGLVVAMAWVILPLVMLVISSRLKVLVQEQKRVAAILADSIALQTEIEEHLRKTEAHLRHIAVLQKAERSERSGR
ncbi:MAG: hypothetical protein GY788_07365 [bacterium]|nr:hypothetical protein [bacterium]